MELRPAAVAKTFTSCLFKDGESTDGHVEAEGIRTRVGFHPGRLAEERDTIAAMLRQLPEKFNPGTGDGASFLEACKTRKGELWTGDHATMDQLFMLGIAAGFVKCLLPREMWESLPGGMPYYSVDLATPAAEGAGDDRPVRSGATKRARPHLKSTAYLSFCLNRQRPGQGDGSFSRADKASRDMLRGFDLAVHVVADVLESDDPVDFRKLDFLSAAFEKWELES